MITIDSYCRQFALCTPQTFVYHSISDSTAVLCQVYSSRLEDFVRKISGGGGRYAGDPMKHMNLIVLVFGCIDVR